jgi:hypothetical protein
MQLRKPNSRVAEQIAAERSVTAIGGVDLAQRALRSGERRAEASSGRSSRERPTRRTKNRAAGERNRNLNMTLAL